MVSRRVRRERVVVVVQRRHMLKNTTLHKLSRTTLDSLAFLIRKRASPHNTHFTITITTIITTPHSISHAFSHSKQHTTSNKHSTHTRVQAAVFSSLLFHTQTQLPQHPHPHPLHPTTTLLTHPHTRTQHSHAQTSTVKKA